MSRKQEELDETKDHGLLEKINALPRGIRDPIEHIIQRAYALEIAPCVDDIQMKPRDYPNHAIVQQWNTEDEVWENYVVDRREVTEVKR